MKQAFAFSVPEAAEYANLGKTTLWAAIARGDLKAKRYGRRTLIEAEALRSFLSNLPDANPQHVAA